MITISQVECVQNDPALKARLEAGRQLAQWLRETAERVESASCGSAVDYHAIMGNVDGHWHSIVAPSELMCQWVEAMDDENF